MLNESREVLLITGCISPNKNIYKLKLKDEEERLRQYLQSIKYYIEETKFKKIIFCDNSGNKPNEKIVELAKICGKEFEWLYFIGNLEKVVKQGKGYGEAEIVKYVLEHSELISEQDYLVKVTGRLLVKNIDLLIKMSNGDVRIWPIKVEELRFYINTRIYMMPVKIYKKYMFDIENLIDDYNGIYLEHAFGICLKKSRIEYKKFRVAPWIEGMSASTGRIYRPTVYSYLKDCGKLWIYSIEKGEKMLENRNEY